MSRMPQPPPPPGAGAGGTTAGRPGPRPSPRRAAGGAEALAAARTSPIVCVPRVRPASKSRFRKAVVKARSIRCRRSSPRLSLSSALILVSSLAIRT